MTTWFDAAVIISVMFVAYGIASVHCVRVMRRRIEQQAARIHELENPAGKARGE